MAQQQLFDRLDTPTFEGKTPEEAWAACVAWEDWMYENAQSFSDDGWDEAVKTASTNYDRYYQTYVE